jgi:sucrose-6-phosphate hydrolase SacC (GH32 family)
MKSWTVRSQIEGFYECPDFFELPVVGDPPKRLWVLSAADRSYMLGRFDGEQFLPETPIFRAQAGSAYYAPQTFSDMPDGRRVQIAWGKMPSPGMPFNQMMGFPCALTLRPTAAGPRLCWWPVDEIKSLATGAHSAELRPTPLVPGKDLPSNIESELFDILAEFDPGEAAVVGLNVRGTEVIYDAARRELRCNDRAAPLAPEEGREVRLRVLADRTSLEIFAADGLVTMPIAVQPRSDNRSLTVFARGGTAMLRTLTVDALESIWPKEPPR